jgi:outer membrane protein assembly factor BamE
MACEASMNQHFFISLPITLRNSRLTTLRTTLTWGIALPVLFGLLSACSVPTLKFNSETRIYYIPEVVQGNFISREQREFLKLGMSRQQVRDVLGTPLVASVFHDQRWDYVFTIRRQGVPPQSFSVSVWFKGDELERIVGDELPSETEFVTKLVAKKSNLKVPRLEAKEEDLRKFPIPVRNTETSAVPAVPLPSSYPPLEPATR